MTEVLLPGLLAYAALALAYGVWKLSRRIRMTRPVTDPQYVATLIQRLRGTASSLRGLRVLDAAMPLADVVDEGANELERITTERPACDGCVKGWPSSKAEGADRVWHFDPASTTATLCTAPSATPRRVPSMESELRAVQDLAIAIRDHNDLGSRSHSLANTIVRSCDVLIGRLPMATEPDHTAGSLVAALMDLRETRTDHATRAMLHEAAWTITASAQYPDKATLKLARLEQRLVDEAVTRNADDPDAWEPPVTVPVVITGRRLFTADQVMAGTACPECGAKPGYPCSPVAPRVHFDRYRAHVAAQNPNAETVVAEDAAALDTITKPHAEDVD